MNGMPRADRRRPNDDNARNNPRPRREEPVSPHELRQQRDNARAASFLLQQENDELQQRLIVADTRISQTLVELTLFQNRACEWEATATRNNQLYISEQQRNQRFLLLCEEEQQRSALLESQLNSQQQNLQGNDTRIEQVSQRFESSQIEVKEWQERVIQYQQLYLGEQEKYIQTTCNYKEEQKRAIELIRKYEEADSQRIKYFTLYSETQAQLKKERKSKAGIRSWETRRKVENQRLKEEIAEMTVLLRESLLRKGEAVDNLYVLADRMDQMQQLVDSAEDESEVVVHQTGLRQKLKRIWMSIQDILAE
jgi:hypothetical protein